MAPTIITIRDLEALAVRLESRARSVLTEQPALAADLSLAAEVILKWVADGDLDPIVLDDD
jgi:hypothetical protein